MECPCGYLTIDRSNYRRHQRSCKSIQKRDYDTLMAKHVHTLRQFKDVRSTLERRVIELHKSRQEVERLRACVQALRAKRQVTNVRDCNICIVNNVYAYRKEPRVVPPATVQRILSEPSESVPQFLQLKHFTGPLCARNIHLPNRRGNTVQVVEECTGGILRWVHHDRKTMVEELFETHLDELRESYNADCVCEWKKWYDTHNLGGERNTTEWKDQLSKVDLVLVNNQQTRPTEEGRRGRPIEEGDNTSNWSAGDE